MSVPLREYDSYLVPDWDGQGALPIQPQTLTMARTLIEMFPKLGSADIAPGADGSIGFEWVEPDGIATLDVGFLPTPSPPRREAWKGMDE